MTGVRLSLFKCTAGGVSPKCAYGSRLSSCIRAALEAWGGCQCGSWALVGLEGGNREEVSWLASVNINTCGVTPGEKCGGSMTVVLAIGFFSSEICCNLL